MGTTAATNALLERKGVDTLLLITKGFADLLRIGYQARPKLFELNIQLPTLLYRQVSEIEERLDAKGGVLTELNENNTRLVLRNAKASGFNSVAIAFMHSYINSDHEDRVAVIAAEECKFEKFQLL